MLGAKITESKYIPSFLKGTVKAAANAAINQGAKETAEQAAAKAVNESVAKIPGGANTVSALTNLGISKTQMVDTAQQLSAASPSILEGIKQWFLNPSNRNSIFIGIAIILLIVGIGLAIYIGNKSTSNFQNVEAKAGIQTMNAQVVGDSLGGDVKGIRATPPPPPPPSKKREGFQNPPGPVVDSTEDLRLVNLQPLTIKQVGFLGPIRSGVFSERDAVQQALRAGFRTFLFQIDYHEDESKQPPSFPVKGEPCLLYRDDAGVLTSINAGSIRKTAEAIADLAFQPTLVAKDDPILLILHGLRAPDSVTNPRGYLEYCSKIAMQLKALAPYHLGLTAEGDYHRQALAGQLFTSGVSKFEKKVIILSTFDTSLFRTVEKLGLKPFSSADDLDYWVNGQIYKDDEKAAMGVATVNPVNTPLRASIVDLAKVLGLSEQEKKAWAMKNRDTFTVALPSQNENPNKASCEVALKTLGINVVPLDIFSSPIEETRDLIGSWDKKTWNLKPLALRATARKGKV